MLRKLLCGSLLALAIGGLAATSQAGPISTNNPYRSFNIGGVNYGSMQWERTQRKAAAARSSGNRGWGWRR
jgi:hypothetical protein